MPQKDNPTLLLKDARIIFRNLAGREREFNSEGDRNFCVVLEPDHAKKLLADGWRVKQLKPREEGEEGDYILKVKANYKTGKPPKIVLKRNNVRTELSVDDPDKADVSIVDAVDIASADVFINGWWSDMQGGGYSAFLKTLFVTVELDPLELMYENEESAQTPGTAEDDEEALV